MSGAAHSVVVHDLIGLGFGPANLAVAAALTDKWSKSQDTSSAPLRNCLFIEKHPQFLWHPGMLLPGARMQISCLKDLVTLRDPTSPLTFLSYLHSQNRLITFINRGTTIPTRREFADYLAWAAGQVQAKGIKIAYGEQVISISEVEATEGKPRIFEVVSRALVDQSIIKRYSKHLIISSGGSPRIPRAFTSLASPTSPCQRRLIHTASYVSSIDQLLQNVHIDGRALKIAVVGSGQSAAEVALDLCDRLSYRSRGNQSHQVDILIKRGSLKPSDDSPFVNEIFDPDRIQTYFDSSSRARKQILAEYKNTNYGVVNPHTLEVLYEYIYSQKIEDDIEKRYPQRSSSARTRLTICPYQLVLTAETQNKPEGSMVELMLQDTLNHSLSTREYDAVICGTGYERTQWLRLLRSSNLAKRFGLDLSNEPFLNTLDIEPEHEDLGSDMSFDIDSCSDDSNESPSRNSESSALDSLATSMTSLPPADTSSHVRIRVTRNYQLVPERSRNAELPELSGRVYLQGHAEASHGLSDTLLSVASVRAGEIVQDLVEAEKVN